MLACKPTEIPVSDKVTLKKIKVYTDIDEPLAGVNNYQKLVGKLIYLTLTRPDISYAVHFLSQVMHAPTKRSLKYAFKVLRYSKGSLGLGLNFKLGKCLDLSVYVDLDWERCKVIRKYVIGFFVFLGDNFVSWKRKNQSVLARFSAEAEFRAMFSVTCEVMWILKILKEMKVDVQVPVPLHCDNNVVIQIAANPVFHVKTKHFELDLYFLREKIQEGFIKTEKVKSTEDIADVFTKGLSVKEHKFFCDKPSLLDLYKN
ncbi:hypothetical protein Tco_0856014 [Tanacetum coccineum]